MHDTLREKVREAAGRDHSPSVAILDIQSVPTTEVAGPRGYDAARNVRGRKRNVLVDTLGLVLALVVAPADIQDDPAILLRPSPRPRSRVLKSSLHEFPARSPLRFAAVPVDCGTARRRAAKGAVRD